MLLKPVTSCSRRWGPHWRESGTRRACCPLRWRGWPTPSTSTSVSSLVASGPPASPPSAPLMSVSVSLLASLSRYDYIYSIFSKMRMREGKGREENWCSGCRQHEPEWKRCWMARQESWEWSTLWSTGASRLKAVSWTPTGIWWNYLVIHIFLLFMSFF